MSAQPPRTNQGEKLLWALGAGVCVLAAAFFALLYTGGSGVAPTVVVDEPALEPPPAQTDNAALPRAVADIEIRLNRARLAVDAGMLLEPEGFSAWSIYSAILDADAGNPQAAAALAEVADTLADQAHDAFAAGRRSDARDLADRILSRFPEHADALDVVERIEQSLAARNPQPQQAVALPERPQRTVDDEPRERPRPAEPAPVVDRVAEIYTNFTRALAAGTLRPPEQGNALEYLAAMQSADAGHAMTQDARQQLFEAMFARHNAAFDQLDSATAIEWLDLAAALDTEPARVAAAREQLLDLLAAETAQESILASELTLRSYTAPVYPPAALRREVEGWVDVAFTLSDEGRPRDVEVIEASNSLFRDAATRAVEAWEFEPFVAYERVVEQRAHTRIRFVLEE